MTFRCFIEPNHSRMDNMKTTKTIAALSIALLIAGKFTNAACPNGSCGAVGGATTTGTFKGSPSKMPEVTAVDSKKITVGDKIYLVDGTAKIVVDRKDAAVTDIKPGMRVLVNSRCVDRKEKLYQAIRITAKTP